MAKGFARFAVDGEDAGHALNVACGPSGPFSAEPGGEGAADAFWIDVLAPVGARETEGFMEFAVGIADAREMSQSVRKENL